MKPQQFNQIPPVTPPRTGDLLNFVVLKHTGGQGDGGGGHFDLMLEIPGHDRLWTWRIPAEPAAWKDQDIGAQRIADHRKLYLEYQGEISGGRGAVQRVAAGIARVEESDNATLRIRLEGEIHRVIRLPL